jgi:hypothetical protein
VSELLCVVHEWEPKQENVEPGAARKKYLSFIDKYGKADGNERFDRWRLETMLNG